MFCSFKNSFGKVGEGSHSYRFFDIAIIDVLSIFILAFIIHLFIPKVKYFLILLLLFILGIISHRVFCVRTTVDKLLFA